MTNFLISGSRWSGRDLLAIMLAAHPDVQMAVESHYEHPPSVPQTAAAISARLRGFRAARKADAKGRAKVCGNTIATDDIGAFTENAIRDDKGAIESFLSETADLKHIFVIRDGRTYVRSMALHQDRSVDDACRSWLFSVRLLRASRKRRLNGLVVKFEELAANREPALRGICDFLGLEYVAAMSSKPERALDQAKTPMTPLPTHITRQMESELRYCGYLDAAKTIPRDDVKSREDALVSDLQEDVAVMAQQLSYQTNQRRIEVDEIAKQARDNALSFSADLASREEQLTNADRDIRRLAREVEERDERLRNADRDIRRLMSEVEDREGRLKNADRDLRSAMHEVEGRGERLRNVDQDIRRLLREVEDREERLRNADRDLRRLMSEVESRDERLEKTDQGMRSLTREVDVREELLRSADRDIHDLTSALSDRRGKLATAEENLRRLAAEIENQNLRLANMESELSDARRQVQGIESSKLWRAVKALQRLKRYGGEP
jgi:peptidoglycan hydrolase CwlO-like protein